MKAIAIDRTTLLRIGGPPSISGGNCFHVETDTGDFRYISNMRLENFEGLIKRGELKYPVEIEDVTPHSAKVVDQRVPQEWMTDHICSVCYR